MTTNNEERVTVYANVYESSVHAYELFAEAEADAGENRLDVVRCVELRPGETILTREMRAKIEQFTGSLWTAETRRAVEEILLILDGKDGQ